MAANTPKQYLGFARPANRSTMTDYFRFIITADDYKAAWVEGRAMLRFGRILAKIRDEGEQDAAAIPPSQYTLYDVDAVETLARVKPEPSVKQLVSMANAKGIKINKELQALVDQLNCKPDLVSSGDNVEEKAKE